MARHCANSFISEALTADEKGRLTITLYGAPGVSHLWLRTELFAWEKSWCQRRLPPSPARVLLGACGAGREALALLDRGYTVDAFEPAPTLFAVCRGRLAGRARVFLFRYQDLSAAVLDRTTGPSLVLADECYDAVLLGWGSLSHLGSASERERLLRAVHQLCPRGPILASFWRADDPSPFATAAYGRAARFGRRLGQAARRIRRLPADHPVHELFTPSVGFGYGLMREEIEGLATLLGRTVVWELEVDEPESWTMPHVTLLPGDVR